MVAAVDQAAMLYSGLKSEWSCPTMTNYYERLRTYLLSLVAVARTAARGQGMVEYAAILSFVAACMVVAELYLQPHINATLNTVANSFPHVGG